MRNSPLNIVRPKDKAVTYTASKNSVADLRNINTTDGPLVRYTAERDYADDNLNAKGVILPPKVPITETSRIKGEPNSGVYPKRGHVIEMQKVVRFIFQVEAKGDLAANLITSIERTRIDNLRTPAYRIPSTYGLYRINDNHLNDFIVHGGNNRSLNHNYKTTQMYRSRSEYVFNSCVISEFNTNRKYQEWRTIVKSIIDEFDVEEIEGYEKHAWYSNKYKTWFVIGDANGTVCTLLRNGIVPTPSSFGSRASLAILRTNHYNVSPHRRIFNNFETNFKGEDYKSQIALTTSATLSGINYNLALGANLDDINHRSYLWELNTSVNQQYDEVPVNIMNVVLYRDLGLPYSHLKSHWLPEGPQINWNLWEEFNNGNIPLEPLDGTKEAFDGWLIARHNETRYGGGHGLYAYEYAENKHNHQLHKINVYKTLIEKNQRTFNKCVNMIFLDISEPGQGEKLLFAYRPWGENTYLNPGDWLWHHEHEIVEYNGTSFSETPDWLAINGNPVNQPHNYELENLDDEYWASAIEDFRKSQIFGEPVDISDDVNFTVALDNTGTITPETSKNGTTSEILYDAERLHIEESLRSKKDYKDMLLDSINIFDTTEGFGSPPTDPANSPWIITTDGCNPIKLNHRPGKIFRPVVYANFPEPESGVYTEATLQRTDINSKSYYGIQDHKTAILGSSRTNSFYNDPGMCRIKWINKWDFIIEETKKSLEIFHGSEKIKELLEGDDISIQGYVEGFVDSFDSSSHDKVIGPVVKMIKGFVK